MINKSNVEHAVIAVALQALLAPLFWLLLCFITTPTAVLSLFISGSVAVSIFIGREYGQVERKSINQANQKLRDKYGDGNFQEINITRMRPHWHAFRKGLWTLDHFMDVILALAACTAVVCAVFLVSTTSLP